MPTALMIFTVVPLAMKPASAVATIRFSDSEPPCEPLDDLSQRRLIQAAVTESELRPSPERDAPDLPAPLTEAPAGAIGEAQGDAGRRSFRRLVPGVAAAVVRALTARRPKARYVVGRTSRLQVALARTFPTPIVDLAVRREIERGGKT